MSFDRFEVGVVDPSDFRELEVRVKVTYVVDEILDLKLIDDETIDDALQDELPQNAEVIIYEEI